MKANFQENFLYRYFGMYVGFTTFLHLIVAYSAILCASLYIYVFPHYFFSTFIDRLKKNSLFYNSNNLLPSTFATTGTLSHLFRINIVPSITTRSGFRVYTIFTF